MIFTFHASRLTFHVLCVFLFSRFTVFMSFFFHESRFTIYESRSLFSFSLAFLSILLLPCFSSCFSPTLLFFLFQHLPCFSFYISSYLVFPYLASLSTSLLPCFSFYIDPYLALRSISASTLSDRTGDQKEKIKKDISAPTLSNVTSIIVITPGSLVLILQKFLI